ncbi:LexA family protein [Paenibacillus oleatilyticus]|uniref:LexA family protein n=1 Tax=Paenibacillus oleatilyticus TaxID=2594886 RepID=UPI001C1FB430|nr:helix-turn-helix domain-containing protein [Paenibacillus oleatilyticus]MBU7320305.1 helix-turn-helix domain-containing protein [Paenibacillus oleatilyticus]
MGKHQAIIDFIARHYKEKGFSPTVREIAYAVGLRSTSNVHRYLDILEARGLVERIYGSARAIKLIGEASLSEVEVLKKHKEVPSVILWQGRRYVYDPVR